MAFWLIVALGSTAGLFFLLHADFVGATQLLVYVGGTVVLLIFGVMLTASGPYNVLKSSPGNLILVAAVGAIVLFIMYLGMAGVNWDGSVLRQVAISAERFGEIQNNVEDEETKSLLESSFQAGKSNDTGGTELFQFSAENELSADEETELLSVLKENGLKFAPATETGGTIRPLGFGLLGARPDKDLQTPEGLQKLSEGFYVVRPRSPHQADALSTGFLLPFEIVSVHLLVVLIGAAYLARAKRRVDAET
jgi:NADH:ubiquinone oxidoreductase subunit 6 (subunit J)